MITNVSLRVVLLAIVSAPLLTADDGPVILNEAIHPLYFEPLDYPLGARLRGDQGAVVIRVALDSDGKVREATPISGPRSLIPDTVLNAKKWRFKPSSGVHDVVIVYIFKVEGLCVLPCTSQFIFRPPNVAYITKGEAVTDH